MMLHKRFGLSYFVEWFLDSSFAANASQAATAVRPALFSQWLFDEHSTAIYSTIARELFFSNTSSTHQTLVYAPNMPVEHGAERDRPFSQGRATWTQVPLPRPADGVPGPAAASRVTGQDLRTAHDRWDAQPGVRDAHGGNFTTPERAFGC